MGNFKEDVFYYKNLLLFLFRLHDFLFVFATNQVQISPTPQINHRPTNAKNQRRQKLQPRIFPRNSQNLQRLRQKYVKDNKSFENIVLGRFLFPPKEKLINKQTSNPAPHEASRIRKDVNSLEIRDGDIRVGVYTVATSAAEINSRNQRIPSLVKVRPEIAFSPKQSILSSQPQR